MCGFEKTSFDIECSNCGAKFEVITTKLEGHNEKEDYFCPECSEPYKVRASVTPIVNLISKRTDIRKSKIKKLAELLKNYRASEQLNPKEENIEHWVSQFTEEYQEIILDEMISLSNKMFVLESEVDDFLKGLITNKKLVGESVKKFWSSVSLLTIQINGNSQNDMLDKFKKILKDEIGIDISVNDNSKKHFIYIDDFLFTGNRLYQDLSKCFKNLKDNKFKIDIIYIGYYKTGQYYYSTKLLKEFKSFDFKFWRMIELENNIKCQNQSDVLWPIEDIKTEPLVKDFLEKYDKDNTIYRDLEQTKGCYCEEHEIFTSEKNRQILEKEFTLAGIRIINKINKGNWKPLGLSSFNNLGFGALVFSYRNCPNNAPLCLWWGDWDNNTIWYPLLQRKTYK